jgi:hypothetical protein
MGAKSKVFHNLKFSDAMNVPPVGFTVNFNTLPQLQPQAHPEDARREDVLDVVGATEIRDGEGGKL